MLSQVKTFNGGWYCDVLCSGEYAVTRWDSKTIETHLGPLEPPERVLFPRITTVGGFRIAGQGHETDRAIEWNGGWHVFAFKACGVSPVIYDQAGRMLVSDCGHGIGSQGFRFVRPDGTAASGDSSYAPANGIDLFEWTDLGDGYRVGQGPDDNGAWFYDGAKYYEVIQGRARFVRAHRDGDKIAMACWVEPQQSVIAWTTVAEIRAQLTPMASPRRSEPTPAPTEPNAPPTQEPVVSIPSADIIAAVTEAKAEVEALGYRFKTVEEAMRDNYAHYTFADKQQAFLVTLRAAWKLAQRYPNAGIGLERYEGVSGTPSPFPEDGPARYSGDIILLGKSGPSCDVLIAGVQPAAQVDTTTDPQAPANWARDWSPPINPYRGAQTTPQPVPVTPPVVAPPVPDGLALILADIQAHIHAHRDEFNHFRLQMAEMEVALRNEIKAQPEITLPQLPDLEAMGWPTYTGTAKGGWPVGTLTFTLTPKED